MSIPRLSEDLHTAAKLRVACCKCKHWYHPRSAKFYGECRLNPPGFWGFTEVRACSFCGSFVPPDSQLQADPRPPLRFLDTQAVQDSHRFGAALGRLDLARGTHSFTACQEAFQKGYLSVTEPEPDPPLAA